MCNLRKNVSTTVRTPVLSSWLHLGSLVLRYKDNLDRGNPPALHFREQGERFDKNPTAAGEMPMEELNCVTKDTILCSTIFSSFFWSIISGIV